MSTSTPHMHTNTYQKHEYRCIRDRRGKRNYMHAEFSSHVQMMKISQVWQLTPAISTLEMLGQKIP